MLLAATAVWVHTALRRFASAGTVVTHALLAGTGIACGALGFVIYAEDLPRAVLSALIGFGVVHVPAAFILALKSWRRGRRVA